MLLSFAVQFWTHWFTNSSFCRDTTWGCFKIRDTQKVNRSSEPLDLGAWKSWETPGKLCFTTIPSYWDQFWVVSPGWYESTLSTTPKTPRKVIPVKDSSGEKLGIGSSWANSEWKSHDPKWLDGPSCSRSWKFTSDLFHLDLNRSFNFFSCILEIAQIANAGTMWHALQRIFQLLGHSPLAPHYMWTQKLLHWPMRLVCVINLGFFFVEAKTLPLASKILNTTFLQFFSRQTQDTSMFCMSAIAMFSAPWRRSKPCWTWTWPPCNPRPPMEMRIGGNVVGWFYWQGMLLVFFFFSFCSGAGTATCFFEDVLVGVVWLGSFFPWIVLAMLWW